MDPRVWLITGCSSGIGRELARLALERGQRVIATARDPGTLAQLVAAHPERALALALDVTDREAIARVVDEAEQRFGAIDVLVNNAGYGYLAAIEEGEEPEVRTLFETNFFGPLALVRAVLPGMRARGRGHIIAVSSQAGLMSNPGTGYYSASKFALEAMSEALAKEVRPLGIRVCAVEPGPFRTDWAGRSMKQTRTPIAAYADTVGLRRSLIAQTHGNQPGDPRRAAEAILALAESDDPPLQLLLGRIVLETYRARLAGIEDSLARWESVTLGADYPESAGWKKVD